MLNKIKPIPPLRVKGSTPPPIGGLSFSLSSGKGKKKEDPSDPVNSVKKEKPLAEKTIEDVLLHFAETAKVARRRYRQFVKNGIDQACPPSLSLRRGGRGKRPEFQGGGLVRSAGGNTVSLLENEIDQYCN